MSVQELIDFLERIQDKDKPVVFDDKFIPDSYASITTVKDKELYVVLDQYAWEDNKSHFLKGEKKCQ